MPTPETVEWKKNRKKEFTRFITNEIFQTEGDRGSLEQKWLSLISQWRAGVQGDGVADVPFIGAMDIDMPLTAVHFEPVYSDFMQTVHVPKNFWSVVPLRSDTVDISKPFQEFLSFVERNEIRMRKVNKRAFIDLIILGTCVYKDHIRHQSKTVKDYNDSGEIVDRTRVEFKPKVQHVPLQDFYIPAYADKINPDEINGAPWVSHRFELTLGQLAERAEGQSPFLPNYDKKAVRTVQSFVREHEEDDIKEKYRQEDEFQPFHDRKVELHEVWARWDVDGDGIDEDIVVIWSQDTAEILRATHNPHLHGERPFHSAQYIPGPGFYGIGIAEADEWAQLAMTRLLNNAINNTLIANARMFGVPQGSTISADESIYPGKTWYLGPDERVESIQMGEVYPSIFQMMEQLMQWSEQRTSVSELRQGNISNLPSRTPASTVLSTLQEGNKKFDMVLANLREDAFKDIGRHVVQNLVQISRDDPKYIALAQQVLGPEDGQKVSQILRGPVHEVEDMFGIDVTATSSQVNKEVEKQSMTGLLQLVSQMYPQMVQFAQALGDQNLLRDTVQSAYTGQVELLRRLLESFDIQNPEQFVPSALSEAARQQQAGQQPGQGPETAPAGPGPFGAEADPLAALLGL